MGERLRHASMMGAVDSIPHFAAPAPKSERTERSWSATKAGGEILYALDAERVLGGHRGEDGHPEDSEGAEGLEIGLDPAPPPESDPAMVSAFGISMAS